MKHCHHSVYWLSATRTLPWHHSQEEASASSQRPQVCLWLGRWWRHECRLQSNLQGQTSRAVLWPRTCRWHWHQGLCSLSTCCYAPAVCIIQTAEPISLHVVDMHFVGFVARADFSELSFSCTDACVSLFPCVWLSVPVQLIVWKNLSLKWPVMCQVGR